MKKKNLSLLLIILVLIVPVVLTACGGDDDNGDNKKDESKAGALSQTFESSTGIKVKYPEGWIARDGDNGVEIANSEAALEAMDSQDEIEEIPADAAAIMIFDPAEMAQLPGLADMDAKAVLEMMSGFIADETATVGDIEEVKIGDHDAVRAKINDTKAKSEGYLIIYKLDDTTAIIAAPVVHEGNLSAIESVANDMLASLEYTAPAAAG